MASKLFTLTFTFTLQALQPVMVDNQSWFTTSHRPYNQSCVLSCPGATRPEH